MVVTWLSDKVKQSAVLQMSSHSITFLRKAKVTIFAYAGGFCLVVCIMCIIIISFGIKNTSFTSSVSSSSLVIIRHEYLYIFVLNIWSSSNAKVARFPSWSLNPFPCFLADSCDGNAASWTSVLHHILIQFLYELFAKMEESRLRYLLTCRQMMIL